MVAIAFTHNQLKGYTDDDIPYTQAASPNLRLRYNYRPDSDLFIIYNVGTQFASIAPANPRKCAIPALQ